MFIKLVILSILLLSIAGLGFGIKIILKSRGQFPETHISRNAEMKKRGISCARLTDTGCHSSEGFPGCSTCEESRI